MNDYDYWYNTNKAALIYLYNKLFIISKNYGINLIDNEDTFESYLEMMYNLSNKKVINKEDYPQFFPKIDISND
jgi:hypothetical protein